MARNEEKAQSMLYRFREAQAAELGLGTRADKRPRMASACKSLRECERWRGEILREISRKVSKIQDSGLTDYEVRDLNDEINKLLREKRHWENQIVALGGANYRRNVAMLDDDGKEVPGTKGYKYFGRAKDLPGVKELFQSRKKEEEEENQALAYYKKFMNQGPAYYGDLDENDEELQKYEQKAMNEDLAKAYLNVQEALGLDSLEGIKKIPLSELSSAEAPHLAPINGAVKRKAPDADGDVDMSSDDTKRTKTDAPPPKDAPPTDSDAVLVHAKLAASFMPFLTPEHLIPPKLPNREELEQILLELRKKALVEEYFGDS
ncbi:Isy1-like splicing factor [Pluteus cervinus]|uniref:Isy1-like splicing factor n=1 Tax=Pluteus cervinus TaxID=181527 RepID=A0ACD3BD33_9AGAR|nr:Isy1-like splicing factor [Pluteus cervinus]